MNVLPFGADITVSLPLNKSIEFVLKAASFVSSILLLDIDNFTDCLIQRNDHVKIAKKLFSEKTKIARYENKDDEDITGKTVTNSVDFILSTGIVRIYCDFYSEEYKKNIKNRYKVV